MRKQDVQIGMKVVPFQKTAWCSLTDSYIWKDALEDKQNYLYVVEFDEDENCFVLNNIDGDSDGDFFHPEDFNPYMEGLNICPHCRQEIK